MRKIIFLFCLIVCIHNAFSQSKKEILSELKITKAKLDSLQLLYFQQQTQYQQKITYLESIIEKVKFVLENNVPTINNSSSQPSYNTINENLKPQQNNNNQNNPTKLGSGDGLTPRTGGTIYTGPRGGQYYINKNGNKTYIRKH